jgi:hypothetical protein
MSWWDAAVGFGSTVIETTTDAAKSGAEAVSEVVDDVVDTVAGAVDDAGQAASDALDDAAEAWDDFVAVIDEQVTFGFDEEGNFAAGLGDPSKGGFLVIVDADPSDGSVGHWFTAGMEEKTFAYGSSYTSDASGLRTQTDVSSRSGESSSSVGWDAHTSPTGQVSGSVRGETVVKTDDEDWSAGGEASLTDGQLGGTVRGERSGNVAGVDYTVGAESTVADGEVTAQGRGTAAGSSVMGTEWSAEGQVDYADGEVTGEGSAEAGGTFSQGHYGAEWTARGEAAYADGTLSTAGQAEASGPLVDLLEEVARTHDPDGAHRRAAAEEVAVFVGELDPSLRADAILTEGRTWFTRGGEAEQALHRSVDRLVAESRAIYEDGKRSVPSGEDAAPEQGEVADPGTAEDDDDVAPAPPLSRVTEASAGHLERLTLARDDADELQTERHALVQEHLELAEAAAGARGAGVEPDPRATTLRHLREDTLARRRDDMERLRVLRDQDERSDDAPPEAETVTAAEMQDHFRGQVADHVSLVVAAAARAEVAREVLADDPVRGSAVSSVLLQASAVEVEVAELASDEARLLAGETAKLRFAAAEAEATGDLESAATLGRAANGLTLVRDRMMTSARAAHREAVTTAETTVQLADMRPGLIADEALEAVQVAAEAVALAVAEAEGFVAAVDPETGADLSAEDDPTPTADDAAPDPTAEDLDQELQDATSSTSDEAPDQPAGTAPTDAPADELTDATVDAPGAGAGAPVEPPAPAVEVPDPTGFGRGAAPDIDPIVAARPDPRSLSAQETDGLIDIETDEPFGAHPVDEQPLDEDTVEPDLVSSQEAAEDDWQDEGQQAETVEPMG